MTAPSDELKKSIGKIGVSKYGGSSTKPGYLYHDLPFFKTKTHRKGSELRVKKILSVYDVEGRSGLDIGCSVGGISFRLQNAGAKMVAVDYDPEVIQLAKEVEKQQNTGVVFQRNRVDQTFIRTLPVYDFIVWFEQWMWLVKQRGEDEAIKILKVVSNKTNNLFFSTSQGDGKAKSKMIKSEKDVEVLLRAHTDYLVTNLGTVDDNWHKRSLFWCCR